MWMAPKRKKECAKTTQENEILHREQARRPLKMIGLVLLQPQALRRGRFHARRLSRDFYQSGRAAERARDFVGLPLHGNIARQFRRADDPVRLVQQHQPALRTRDSDGRDSLFLAVERGQTLPHRAVHRVDPLRRVLLAVASRQAFDPSMRDPRLGTDHRGFQIQDHGAGAAVTDFNPQKVHDRFWRPPGGRREFRHATRFDKSRRV